MAILRFVTAVSVSDFFSRQCPVVAGRQSNTGGRPVCELVHHGCFKKLLFVQPNMQKCAALCGMQQTISQTKYFCLLCVC